MVIDFDDAPTVFRALLTARRSGTLGTLRRTLTSIAAQHPFARVVLAAEGARLHVVVFERRDGRWWPLYAHEHDLPTGAAPRQSA